MAAEHRPGAPMTLEEQLLAERRARLAAERKLDQKSRELFEANARLARHARSLSDEIVEKREAARAAEGRASEAQSALQQMEAAYAIAERRLWSALETVEDGFAVFDAEDRMLAANRAYLSVFDGLGEVCPGVSHARMIRLLAEEGTVDLQGMAPEDWIAAMLARRREAEIPDRVIRLWSGHYIKLTDRRTPDGDIVTLNQNITDEMRIGAAIEAIEDAFVIFDQDDRLVMANRRYREIYENAAEAIRPGARFEDILRHGLSHGQFPDAEGRHEAWLAERLLLHQAADGRPVEQRLANGRWLRIVEQRTPDGGVAGLRVDITDQKRQQADLAAARDAAEAASRAKSAFLANMSHELRTPMNGVVGMAELLCDSAVDEDQRLYAETIRNSGNALLKLINDVLDFSKIEAQRLTLHPEEFDLETLIQDVLVLMQPIAGEKALELQLDYDMALPARFVGDPGRIRQILMNLVGNAVKFTEKGHVLVRVAAAGDGVRLTVEDTGIGIAPEAQAHIFGEFNQVEDRINRKFEGTGLGLAISRRLVVLMGGELGVTSAPGQGSCFGFSLPLPVAEGAAAPAPPAPLSGRVLVVDDRPASGAVLARHLCLLGLEARALAGAGEEARAACTGPDAPDLVVIGLGGEEGGLALAQSLRAAAPETAILLLSDTPGRAGAEAGTAADAVLGRTARRADLVAALSRLLADRAGQAHEGTDPAAPAAPAPGVRRMRVLAADDNRTNRLVLSKMLALLEVELELVDSGEAALAAVRARRPDLVFMDISMPGMDGLEATRAIRDGEARAGAVPVPVIALTAHAGPGDEAEIRAAGLDAVMTKPVRKPALVAAIVAHAPADALPPAPAAAAE